MEPTQPPAVTLGDAITVLDRGLATVDIAPAPPSAAEERTARFVLFTVADTSYAVAQTFVTELDRVPHVTTVPQAPGWLRGVANLRGDVLSVLDLRAWLSLDSLPPSSGRLLVVRLLDEDFAMGVLVDAVDQLATLDLDAIRPPASPLEGPIAPFLKGVCVIGERLVAVIDFERLLRSPDIRQFEDPKEDSSCEAR